MSSNLVQGAIFTIMVIKVADPRDPVFEQDLAAQIARSPRFFEHAPVILDLKDNLGFLDADEFFAVKALLQRHRLVPVGVQNASNAQQRAAAAAELAVFGASNQNRRVEMPAAASGSAAPVTAAPVAAPVPAPAPAPARPPAPPAASRSPSAAAAAASAGKGKTKLITQPVRSGAQVYARGADLVVTSSVSAGAEIIADGHIHVYGTLRGRAIAGAAGDGEARIFASRLDAELVSVAGRYLVSENIDPEYRGHPVQIALVDDRLTITRS
jgi:septum site-determining protein MinC